MPEIAGALVRVPFSFGMLDGNVTVGHVGVVVVPAVAVVRLVFVGAVIVDAICSLHVGIALELELVYLFVYLRDRIWSPLWSRGWIFGGVVVCPSNSRLCGNLASSVVVVPQVARNNASVTLAPHGSPVHTFSGDTRYRSRGAYAFGRAESCAVVGFSFADVDSGTLVLHEFREGCSETSCLVVEIRLRGDDTVA